VWPETVVACICTSGQWPGDFAVEHLWRGFDEGTSISDFGKDCLVKLFVGCIRVYRV
jgi:hypothetical protein